MNLGDLPLVNYVVTVGPDSRLFDTLLISGPVVVVLIVVFGRNIVTLGIAISYLLGFGASIGYAGVQRATAASSTGNTRT